LAQRVGCLEEAVADGEQHKEIFERTQRLLNDTEKLGNIGSWEFDPAVNRSLWTDNLYQLFGYHPDEIEDPHTYFLDHIVHPGDRAIVRDSFQRSRQNRERQAFEFRGICKDGQVKTYHGVMVPEADADGRIQRIYGLNLDITERKSSDAALRDSREFFRFLSESSPLGVFQTDARGSVEYLNPKWLEIAGMERDDALGFGWSDALHPEDRERVLADWDVCLKERTGYDGEFRFRKPSGEVTWTHTQTAPVFSSEGEVISHVGTNEDITDRKRAEDALRESEERYRFISENIADIVWTLDMDLNTIYVSPSVEAILGFTQEERMQQTLEEMLPAESLKEAQSMLAKELAADADEMSDPDRHVSVEIEYYHKDGSLVWTESVVRAIRDEGGMMVGLLGVARDITERRRAEAALRESEERFRLMFDHSEALISLIDGKADTHYANPAWRAMFGDPETASNPFGLVHPDDRERVNDTWQAFRSGEEELTDLAYRILLPDNEIRHFETSARQADIEGKKLYFVFAHDITHRIREEEQREMLETQLRQSQKMEALGTLAGGISHDFNNILGIIMGNAELAMTDIPDGSPVKDCLMEIRQASFRAKDIVRQILSFSRQSLYEYRPVRIAPLVQDAVRLLRSSMPASIDIDQHVETDADVVLSDQGQINQIVMNLCNNSAQAMPTGGKLTIRLTNALRSQIPGVLWQATLRTGT